MKNVLTVSIEKACLPILIYSFTVLFLIYIVQFYCFYIIVHYLGSFKTRSLKYFRQINKYHGCCQVKLYKLQNDCSNHSEQLPRADDSAMKDCHGDLMVSACKLYQLCTYPLACGTRLPRFPIESIPAILSWRTSVTLKDSQKDEQTFYFGRPAPSQSFGVCSGRTWREQWEAK